MSSLEIQCLLLKHTSINLHRLSINTSINEKAQEASPLGITLLNHLCSMLSCLPSQQKFNKQKNTVGKAPWQKLGFHTTWNEQFIRTTNLNWGKGENIKKISKTQISVQLHISEWWKGQIKIKPSNGDLNEDWKPAWMSSHPAKVRCWVRQEENVGKTSWNCY